MPCKRNFQKGEGLMETKRVLFAGVGGQGAILAAKILVSGLTDAGYDIKMSEVHR